jgi:hypothetical protein
VWKVGFKPRQNKAMFSRIPIQFIFNWLQEVDVYNYHKLQSLEGEMKVYHSQDEGSQYYLNKFVALKNLGLKINCPVLLIRNLSDTLVNGLRGIVKKLDTDSIEVKFLINEKPVFVSISREIFTTFDPVENYE